MNRKTQGIFGWAGKGFTFADAGMTAGFGLMYASIWWIKPIYAVGLGTMSAVLAFLPIAAIALIQSEFKFYRFIGAFFALVYVAGFGANLVTNFGFTAAVGQGEITRAANKNNLYQDARDKIKRLRITIAQANEVIQGPGAWMSSVETEKLIDETLAAKAREKKRIKCGPKCEKLDKRARDLREELAKSKSREAAIATRDKAMADLAIAEKQAAKAPKATSVANNQANFVAGVLSGKLKPDKDTVSWTVVYAAMAMSLFISLFAHVCNLIHYLNPAGIPERDDRNTFERRPWLPSPTDVPATTVPRKRPAVYEATSESSEADWNNTQAALQRIMKRVNAKRAASA